MKQKRNPLLVLGICTLMMILIVACTLDGTDQFTSDGLTAQLDTDGRFVEGEIDLPIGMGTILAMTQFEDGTIRAITQLGVLYDSPDGGETWSPSDTQFDVFSEDEELVVQAATLSLDGSAFMAFRDRHLYIDSQGVATWVEIELHRPSWLEEEDEDTFVNTLTNMAFTSNHKILGRSWNWGILYIIEPSTGEIVLNIGEPGGWPSFDDFIELNGQIVTFGSEGFEIYDLESGGLLEADMGLWEFYNQREFHFDGSQNMRLFLGNQENTFYIVSRTGLYRHTLGGNEVEQVIDGTFNTMVNTAYTFGEVIALEENIFLISYIDRQEWEMQLMSYTFSLEALPTEEMTVFSLFNNPGLRQAVSAFQSQNPHILVRYEVGILSGDSGVTVSDAISTLNTQILAGTGPDVLFLDGMSYDAYIENGILVELSELVAEIKGESEFFENILEYKKVDGGLYVVPTSVFLLLSAGPPELLGEMLTISDLADLVETLREEDGEIQSIIGHHTSETLIRALIHYSYSGLLREDGTMNQEALTEFLVYAKRIQEANMVEELRFTTTVGAWWEQTALESLERCIGLGIFAGIGREQKVNVGALMHTFVFDQMLVTNEKLSWDYQLHNTFIPMDTFGINVGSDHIEESKELLRFILSDEMQSSAQFSGFPVNIAGLQGRKDGAGKGMGMFNAFCPEEGEVFITVYNATVEELERFIEEVAQVDTASVINRIILDGIIQDGVLFLNGDQSLEEAVDGIMMRVNLFLAE
jgi:ABC-type glycerol-3-phosphate transport system substrate-binding protein